MRIVFMGTPDFATGTLLALQKAGHEIPLVVTQPDKPKGRGKTMQAPPVKEMAEKLGIPVYQPDRIRKPEHVEMVMAAKPDMIVVVAFGQLLPKSLLEGPKHGCINVHASLLPKYRGAAPIQWAVIEGEEKTGVTIMQLDEGLDTGDIIAVKEVALAPDETGGSLFDKLSITGAELCVRTVADIEQGKAVFTKQDETLATKTGLITKQMGEIDFSNGAVQIERLIRGLNPWPSAYTYIHGKQLKIWKAAVKTEKCTQAAGTVLEEGKNGIMVATGESILCIQEVQLEGKKRMLAEDFLRGYSITAGEVLGRKKEE